MWIYFLPTIAILGILVSIEDYRTNRIRNRNILIAAGIGILTWVFLAAFGVTTWSLFLYNLLASAGALALGFLIWHVQWWSAGDAKLYAVFVLLVPAGTIQLKSSPIWFLEILVNALIPIAGYLLVKLLVQTTIKQKIEAAKKSLTPKRIVTSIVAIFSISWGYQYIYQTTGIQSNLLTNMILIFIAMRTLEKMLKEQTFAFLAMVCLIRIFVNTHHYTTKTFLISFGLMVMMYIIIFNYLRTLSENYTRKIHVGMLRPGHILAEGILRTGMKAPHFRNKKNAYIADKRTMLTVEEVQKINKWHREGNLHFNTIRVHETIPFAAFLFMGTLITIIALGNLIMFIASIWA